MKLRKKGPVEIEVDSIQGKRYIFKFDLIDFVPRDLLCCDFCPYEANCESFADPRDTEGGTGFNDFCAAKDNELRDGKWTPIPTPGTIEAWLDEIKKERSSKT